MSSATTLYVRREVRSFGPDDKTLGAYARAVAAMRQRPASDPTSWTYQAAMHGSEDANPLPTWNQCQHATWYFVSWHRMFIFYFEQIVRAAVVETGGPADWTLPYWNYGLGGANATLPPTFRTPTVDGQPNPLYVAQRAAGINAGHSLPRAVTTPTFALSRPSFVGAAEFGGGVTPVLWQQFNGPTGRLEQTPHNDIHNKVGGQGWMGNPDTAAQDPIFWLHHSNIDRLWAVWNGQGRANPTDPRWTDQSFSFFDATGTKVSKTCAEVNDTIADLGYTYDPPPAPTPTSPPVVSVRRAVSTPEPPAPEPPAPELVGTTTAAPQLVGDAERTTVPLDPRASSDALARAAVLQPRILLELKDVEAEKNPGSVYGVYVDLPENAPVDEEPLHHVGNLSFFGIERAHAPRGDEHAHGLSVTFDITEVANALRARGQWSETAVDVTFRPHGLIAPDDAEQSASAAGTQPEHELPVTVGSISVFYA
jgi:tyrosinase